MAIINIPVNPYKTMVDVLKNSVNYQKQRPRSIVCNSLKINKLQGHVSPDKQRPRSIVHNSFKNKYLQVAKNLTFGEKAAIIRV